MRFCILLLSLTFTPDLFAENAIALEFSIQESKLDGCTQCGCRNRLALEVGQKKNIWMTFASVEASQKSNWQQFGPEVLSYCGLGSFDGLKKKYMATVGTPYFLVEIQFNAVSNSEDAVTVLVNASVSTFKQFNLRGKSNYDVTKMPVVDFVGTDFEHVIPIVIRDADAQKIFHVTDLVIAITGTKLRAEPRQYGIITVESDFPGAHILLNGGIVGRVSQNRALVLKQIPAGNHEIEVRDFSGRSNRKVVTLQGSQEMPIKLNLLEAASSNSGMDLMKLSDNPQGFSEFFRTRDLAVMVHIPSGRFRMGSDLAGSAEDEHPEHYVFVSSFLIDKTEVTWRQFELFSNSSGVPLPPAPVWGRPDDFPLSNITWDEARQYCEWVGGRLPTEAEWEKAARGSDARAYPWGNDWQPTQCNSISGGLHSPEAVGSYPACLSPYGVIDMVGSHWQWVQDYYSDDAYTNADNENPKGPATGMTKVKRGAHWMAHPQQLYVTVRGNSEPDWRNYSHGFRCARDIGTNKP